MKEKKSNRLSETQNLVSTKIKELVTNTKNNKRYIALPAAPGSGKTTTLLSGLENLYSVISLKEDIQIKVNNETTFLFKGYTSENIRSEIDFKYLENPTQNEKVLILSFSKNAVDDFIKKADKINIKSIVKNENDFPLYIEKETKLSLLIEVSTYHSLLLKVAKPIIDKLGYTLDYSKSNFYKKDINFINEKYKLNLNKNNVNLFFNVISSFHNSPKDFVSFIKEWNNQNINQEINFEIAKKLKTTIDKIYLEMGNNNITMPHCFYYKTVHKMAQQNPNFLKSIFRDSQGKDYNIILVDEAQDSDKIIYDLIKMSNKKAIYVGDRYQNIYEFRGTYNVFDDLESIEKENTEFFNLNESFRYGKSISLLTSSIPQLFNHTYSTRNKLNTIGKKEQDYLHPIPLDITDIKKMIKNIVTTNNNEKKQKRETMNQVAIICRSNKRAFEIYTELKNDSYFGSSIKIESGLKSKTKDFISKGVNAIEDDSLKEQIKNILHTEEFDFEFMINNEEVCNILATTEYSYLLKCKDENLKNAMLQKSSGYETVTIITVHGSKGLEYEKVIVADDYIKESKKISFDDDLNEMDNSIKNEEINIIYTAATRAKESLFFMDGLLYEKLKSKIIEISNIHNSLDISKNIDFLLKGNVIPLEENHAKVENKKNIFQNEGLFLLK